MHLEYVLINILGNFLWKNENVTKYFDNFLNFS